MLKLSKLKAPALAGVVKEKNERLSIAEIKNCIYDGADMIDLHMSCLESTSVESLAKIINSSKLPILALYYDSVYEAEDGLCRGTLFPSLDKPFCKEVECRL